MDKKFRDEVIEACLKAVEEFDKALDRVSDKVLTQALLDEPDADRLCLLGFCRTARRKLPVVLGPFGRRPRFLTRLPASDDYAKAFEE